MTTLAVFDIDDTLIRSSHVDDACFADSMESYLGSTPIDHDWPDYPHHTDPGIAIELFRRSRGRTPKAAELREMEQAYRDALAVRIARAALPIVETPGATKMFEAIASESRLTVAIATGAWKSTALLKLDAAGLSVDGVPCRFADGLVRRKDIVSQAVALNGRPYDRAVLIGDAHWDFQTAEVLGMEFLGVASGIRATRLKALGARSIVTDFLDSEVVVDHLLGHRAV